jgi:hypothetical protein
MDLHIGKEIESKYQESGIKLSEFAKRLDTSTRNIYSIFQRPDINSAQLKKIGDVLGFDFFKFYQNKPSSVSVVNETQEKYQRVPKKVLSVTIELDGDETTLKYWFDKLKKVNASLSG